MISIYSTLGDLTTPIIEFAISLGPFNTDSLHKKALWFNPSCLTSSPFFRYNFPDTGYLKPPKLYDHAFLNDGIGLPPQPGFVQSAFVYEMDCLDSYQSALLFFRSIV